MLKYIKLYPKTTIIGGLSLTFSAYIGRIVYRNWFLIKSAYLLLKSQAHDNPLSKPGPTRNPQVIETLNKMFICYEPYKFAEINQLKQRLRITTLPQ